MRQILEMSKRSWKQAGRNCLIICGILFLLMIFTPTHHERKPIFSEDGAFQVSTQEFVKHFKMSKWKMPSHNLMSVKEFYDYIENPRSSCLSSVLLGGRACHEIEDHTVCLDPSLGWDHEKCIVYEFGASSTSFEASINLLGCEMHSFNPAAHHRNDHKRGERSWFHRVHLEGNTSAVMPGDKVLSLEEVRQQLGHVHRDIDYLHLDMDGEEWPALRRIMTTRVLDHVKQVGIQASLEALDLAPRQRMQRLSEIYQVLVGLEHSGLRLVSSRPQGTHVPCEDHLPELGDSRRVCDYYELVFARRQSSL